MNHSQFMNTLEDRPEVAERLSGFTFYDLTAVSSVLWSMLCDVPSDAPAFPTPPPSEKTLFLISLEGDDVCDLYAEVCGDHIECDLGNVLKLQAYHKAYTRAREAAIRKYNSMTPEMQKIHPLPNVEVDPLKEPFSATPGQPLTEDDKMVHILSACCELIAQQNLVTASERPLPRHVRRRMERKHGITFRPMVMIDFCRTVGARIQDSEGTGIRKALHYVSGHWRTVAETAPTAVLVNGQPKTWVNSHWRGDPALGVITKGYKAGNRFMAGLRARSETGNSKLPGFATLAFPAELR